MTKSHVGVALVALVVSLGVAGGVGQCHYDAKLAASRATADSLKGKADTKVVVAETHEQVAVVHQAEGKQLAAKAIAKDTGLRKRITEIRAQPDTAAGAVAQRDSVIDEQIIVIDTLKAAVRLLGAAYVELKAANDTLHSAIHDLDSAYTILRHPPKRPLLAILLHPDFWVGPGAFAGVCTNGKPCAGAGATASLHWSFKSP